MSSKKILVVDDDSLIRSFLFEDLTRRKYEVETAESVEQALQIMKSDHFDVIISDIRMDNVSGFDFLEIIMRDFSDLLVILMTAYGSVQSAIKAIKMGAFDYLQKPFSGSQVEHVLNKAFEFHRLSNENRVLKKQLSRQDAGFEIKGRTESVKRLLELVRNVAPSPSTILILGESGTGKELIARALHTQSDRSDKLFLAKNCAAIPDTLLESELFGHVKGAFTGAVTERKGIFEEASGGTLFLDEISEMPLGVQAKLLRVLQEGEIQRLGSNKTIPVDVRIIVSTNRDLKQEVQKERFRSDLYYRLNVVPITLPPLRERRDDIPLLADHFVKRYSERLRRTVFGITEGGYSTLMERQWEGNVRELENVVERAVLMSTGSYLDEASFQFLQGEEPPIPIQIANRQLTIREMEKRLILETLQDQGGNRTRTAEILAISIRTLRNKLNEYRSEDPELVKQIS